MKQVHVVWTPGDKVQLNRSELSIGCETRRKERQRSRLSDVALRSESKLFQEQLSA